jgi:hypothetical protein
MIVRPELYIRTCHGTCKSMRAVAAPACTVGGKAILRATAADIQASGARRKWMHGPCMRHTGKIRPRLDRRAAVQAHCFFGGCTLRTLSLKAVLSTIPRAAAPGPDSDAAPDGSTDSPIKPGTAAAPGAKPGEKKSNNMLLSEGLLSVSIAIIGDDTALNWSVCQVRPPLQQASCAACRPTWACLRPARLTARCTMLVAAGQTARAAGGASCSGHL